MAYHVSRERFAELVESALAELPEPFAQYVEEVAIEVRDRPTDRQLRKLADRVNGLLLGLYSGRPRTNRSVLDSATLPDVIYLFQANIEQVCRNEAQLARQVRITLLHEIGHHFGMDEDDLETLGYG